MKAYLAAPWTDRANMPERAARFEAAGHTVTTRWWEFEDRPGANFPSNEDDPYYEDRAYQDFIGVVQADVLVVFNTEKSEGKAVETGIATSLFKPVVLVGVRSNVFHYLPNTTVADDIDGALHVLNVGW